MTNLRERTILRAVRLACLAHHTGMDPAAASLAVDQDVEPAQYQAMKDLALRVILAHTDTEALAVERIKDAVDGKTGSSRVTAAYRANAGVLLPSDVERMAKE